MSYFCAYCGAEIPPDVIVRRKYSPATLPDRMYCNVKHLNLHRQATGGYKEMSLKGREGRVAFLKRVKPKRRTSEETNQKIQEL